MEESATGRQQLLRPENPPLTHFEATARERPLTPIAELVKEAKKEETAKAAALEVALGGQAVGPEILERVLSGLRKL